ncbi:MAG: chromosomal replication initiator protein DnaA [Patescibacteria group bacterium]
MNDYSKLWEDVLGEMEIAVSPAIFATWFRGTFILKIDEGSVHLGVPSTFCLEWLREKHHNSILRILRERNTEVRSLHYVIIKEGDKRKDDRNTKKNNLQMPTITLPIQDHYVNKDDNLNPRYTFETFVVGPFNELAHAASLATANTPGMVYNPLFIYGNTGLGKTHLMQAVGNKIKQLHPQKKIFYLTSEKFGSEYLESLQNNKAQQFKEKYRKYDVIIMDDIQFFSSKEKFQEELFHLFNTFHNTNRQLIFSSDKHPHMIPSLEDRLRSRFSAGMIIDIPLPDQESRTAILRAKCNLSNIHLNDEVIEFLATSIQSNVRELEGVINVVACQTQLKGRPLSLLEIKNLLKNTSKPKKNASVKEVVKIISDFYNIREEAIYDKTRKKEVVKPRQMIMYVLREDFNVSFPSIGEKLGGRDHTTVIHSCEKIKEDLKNNSILGQELSQIRALIG